VSETRRFYHCTHISRAREIVQGMSIEPRHATGSLSVSWWVQLPQLLWAINHIAVKWEAPHADIVVFWADVRLDRMRRYLDRGLFCSHYSIAPAGMVAASILLDDDFEFANFDLRKVIQEGFVYHVGE